MRLQFSTWSMNETRRTEQEIAICFARLLQVSAWQLRRGFCCRVAFLPARFDNNAPLQQRNGTDRAGDVRVQLANKSRPRQPGVQDQVWSEMLLLAEAGVHRDDTRKFLQARRAKGQAGQPRSHQYHTFIISSIRNKYKCFSKPAVIRPLGIMR